MNIVLRAPWIRAVVFCASVAVAACGGPTGPSTPTPTPTPTPIPTPVLCTAGAPQPMTSFTANPATITDGDSFTLSWAAPCGFVSLAQKGQGPFQTLLPSTGSYTLQAGTNGYPTAAGNTVYEARNADTATPREATVTMKAKVAPTISLSGAGSCYPVKAGNAGCNVQVTANASNYDSIAWSGCCGGSGTSSTCHVSGLGSFTCTATATGAGGSAQASAQVTGTNLAPVNASESRSTDTIPCGGTVDYDFWMTDEEAISYCPSYSGVGCDIIDIRCGPTSGDPRLVRITERAAASGYSGGLCYVSFVAQDVWAANSKQISWATALSNCP